MAMAKKVTDMGWPTSDLWVYTPLNEPLLTSELARLSFAQTLGDTHCVSFQPCPNPEFSSQDRYVAQDWLLGDGIWSLRAIFDGHAGHATVEHIIKVLPGMIKARLETCLLQNTPPSSSQISQVLVDSVTSFDDGLVQDLLHILPDAQTLSQMPDAEIMKLITDIEGSEAKYALLERCMDGTTALITLLDPTRHNLWVASLGDCQAVLGQKIARGKWNASFLSAFHNGRNQAEAQRLRQEHPGENEVILDHRVLGAIAVTRAIGDHEFKLPSIFTKRLFARMKPGFRSSCISAQEFIERNRTPPYLSNKPDVRHINLGNREYETTLIMCSDGLLDLYLIEDTLGMQHLPGIWLSALDNRDVTTDAYGNLALALLRHALGGDDIEKVSRNLTVEMAFRWMDDTTILVQRI